MWVLLGLLILIVIFLVIESVINKRQLKKIPIRIYVNGTRGKSSVTRLIAASLRAGGVRTIAKTTGSSPRFILPDGTENLIRRLGQPSISEQVKIIRWTRDYQIDALVIECMALQPSLDDWGLYECKGRPP
jgi:poly-gamma-glutamate synthase PgsB/CapB